MRDVKERRAALAVPSAWRPRRWPPGSSEPVFDFTSGGAFPDVFTNYETFLALAQGFDNTGVRAYKGQAGNLPSNESLLTTALQIHSVEGRHALAIAGPFIVE